jgi:hypothetical protein
VVRLGPRGLEVEWQVGPVPVADGVGKEIIALYTTDIQVPAASSLAALFTEQWHLPHRLQRAAADGEEAGGAALIHHRLH